MEKYGPQYICTNCGYEGEPVSYTPGSFWIELALWICFVVPGLIYSIWRLSARKKVCPECKSPYMIPLDTPMGEKLHQELPKEHPLTSYQLKLIEKIKKDKD